MRPYPQPHPISTAPKDSELKNLENSTGSITADLKKQLELHYHKGLAHNGYGQIDAPELNDFLKLQQALSSHSPPLFQAIKLPKGARPLVNPQCGFAADRECAEGFHFRLPKAPEHNNQEETTAAEFIELYWMAILRALPFDKWDGDPQIQQALNELSRLKLYAKRSTPNTPEYENRSLGVNSIFRGGDWDPQSREHTGGFLSQFLLLDVPYGSQMFNQRERLRAKGDFAPEDKPHMTAWGDWLDVQRGADVGEKVIALDGHDANKHARPTYLHDMAGLARYVHLDKLYQAYLNAAFILIGAPETQKFSKDLPYGCACNDTGGKLSTSQLEHSSFPSEEGFGTFGVPHVLSLVTEAATRALKAVWYQKWVMNLRMRPEAYGGLVERALGNTERDRQSAVESLGAAFDIVKNSEAAKQIERCNAEWNGQETGTFLLPMSFKEGSPIHPAYGAGHATVAAACVTILKAFFDEEKTLVDLGLDPVFADPDTDYTTTEKFSDEEAKHLTVGTELDKLISNIAIGRNMAGVHWRTDYSQSALLGQRIAISMLYRQRRDFHERPWKFQFRTLGGNSVSIEYNNEGREGVYYTPSEGQEQHILDLNDDSTDNQSQAESDKLNAII